jgi:hypothetical protein
MQSEFGHMDSTFDLPDSIQRLLTFHFQIDQPKSMHFPTTRMGPYPTRSSFTVTNYFPMQTTMKITI